MRKVYIIALIVILCTSVLTGCSYSTVRHSNNNEFSMFKRVERSAQWDIVYDTETKVMYSSSGHGLVPLYETDGSLKIWKNNE